MALIATTPVRLGKRVWRPWLGNDDRCDNDERGAIKRAKTTLDEITCYGSSYDSLFFNRGDCHGTQVLIVSQRKFHNCPPAGPTSLARLTVDENMQYLLQVLLHTIESGELESVDQFLKLCDKISDYSTYKFCPGFMIHTWRSIMIKSVTIPAKFNSQVLSSVSNHPTAQCGISYQKMLPKPRNLHCQCCVAHVSVDGVS